MKNEQVLKKNNSLNRRQFMKLDSLVIERETKKESQKEKEVEQMHQIQRLYQSMHTTNQQISWIKIIYFTQLIQKTRMFQLVRIQHQT